jgi:WD40 repeat protein
LTGSCVRTLEGHGDRVSSVCTSPDGSHIISGSYDMTVKVWDALTGSCVRTLEGHGDRVSSVCTSPDGSHIISGSLDKTIKVWDQLSGDVFERMKQWHRRKPFVTIVDWLNRLDNPPALPVVSALTSGGIITKKIAQFI